MISDAWLPNRELRDNTRDSYGDCDVYPCTGDISILRGKHADEERGKGKAN